MAPNPTATSLLPQPKVTLSPPSDFDIMGEEQHSEKAEVDGEDYDHFLNQGSPRSGLTSPASSITAFDARSSPDHESAYHSDSEDDLAKDYSASARLLSGEFRDEEEAPEPKKTGPQHVTWASLPRKGQLLILFLCRMVDFLQVATLQTYLFYQLKHMAQQQVLDTDSTEGVLSDAQISAQAGLLTGGFTGAQVLTAILWGKVADSPKFYGGRKMVLLIGTLGTSIACLGYGFATTFAAALFWRVLAGTVNGLVGIIRTMISEITVERKFQSRAFLLLPMSFNVAGILGPILGGWLADPAVTLPAWFAPGAPLASALVRDHPFALPSIVNAAALFAVFLAVLLGLEETSKAKKGTYDAGLHAAARIKAFVLRRPVDYVYHDHTGYQPLDMQLLDMPLLDKTEKPLPPLPGQNKNKNKHKNKATLPFRRLWTKNVVFTLLSQALYDFHLGAFTNLWTLFLSTPRPGVAPASVETIPTVASADIATRSLGQRNLVWFAGGLGMPSSTVGSATSILGVLGMLLQVAMYPPVHARLGTLRSFRYFLVIFPVAYLLVPFLATLPNNNNNNNNGGGAGGQVSAALWCAIVLILFLHTAARTMTLPASIILLNNCSPHPSVLGTIHGLGQSVSAGFRTVGPIVGGWWYGLGLDWGMVAFSWWAVAAASLVGSVASLLIYEGTGREVVLEDERDE